MTNQASEDIVDSILSTLGIVDRKSGNRPGQIEVVKQIIRTEKLKLLAAVRERVISNKKDQEYRLVDTEYASTRKQKIYLSDGVSRNKLRAEQRESLTKLEAEL